jgi:hypothetical protein
MLSLLKEDDVSVSHAEKIAGVYADRVARWYPLRNWAQVRKPLRDWIRRARFWGIVAALLAGSACNIQPMDLYGPTPAELVEPQVYDLETELELLEQSEIELGPIQQAHEENER